jgi:hypothetical protein
MVVLLTPAAVKSQWVEMEADAAIATAASGIGGFACASRHSKKIGPSSPTCDGILKVIDNFRRRIDSDHRPLI